MNEPRLRLPWEKDPSDREANYRRPIAQHEKARLVVKAASVLGAFLFIKNMTVDRDDVGAEFLIGIGVPLLVAGTLDVIWTLRGRLEHVFIDSRPMQLAAHSALAIAGAAMVTAGVIAKVT
ncbi:MAG: hypothetical protein KY391_02365 [Actinobacteria bacterium]|nr:hypothetical protein [Actinomycetota bacterium]